jgi:hypothetical protein
VKASWKATSKSIAFASKNLGGGTLKSMAQAQFFVGLYENQWIITHQNRQYGPYRTRQEAVKTAVDVAYKEGKKGHETKVLVQDEDDQFHAKWSFGQDAYPPKY